MLMEVLENREKYNKTFLYYKNSDGEINLIAFQNGLFFTLEEDGPRLLNPILVGRVLEDLKRKQKTLIGIGQYGKEVNVFQNYITNEIINKRERV